MSIGKQIKFARNAKGFTQFSFSKQIGKTYSTVQKYELDIITPPVDVLSEISKITDLPISFFIEHSPFDDIDSLLKFKHQILEILKSKNAISNDVNIDSISDYNYYQLISRNIYKATFPDDNSFHIFFKGYNNEEFEKETFPLYMKSKNMLSSRQINLLDAFDKLNEQGKDVAIIRIQELAKIEDYTE